MLNRIIIMGRLTRDPELRRTQNGTAVCTFTVAVDRDRQSRDQEKQTDFIDVTVWRQTAEFVCKYFGKGKMIIVEGSMQSRKWTDKAGQNRVSWEIAANNVMFGESKSASQGGDYGAPSYGGQSYGSPAESYTAPAGGGSFAEIEEDGELPF
jgi:single-strand DNA-binding protein